MQTCNVNSLSRCNSKFRIDSAKDLPVGAPEELKTQAHSEQPQPRKRSCSIHTSLRRAAIYRRKTKSRPTMFRFIFFSLLSRIMSAFEWPSRRIGATCCFDRGRADPALGESWFGRIFGGKHAQIAGGSGRFQNIPVPELDPTAVHGLPGPFSVHTNKSRLRLSVAIETFRGSLFAMGRPYSTCNRAFPVLAGTRARL